MGDSIDTDSLPNTAKAKILVADDSKIVRVTAAKTLGDKFDLVMAEDGEEAWEKLSTDPDIQMVFTDLGMPRLDGFGLIERIRGAENERIRNQPVVVITGAAEDESVKRKVFEVGATDFISKPFKATELVARAEAHVSYRRDKDSLQQSVDVDLLTGALNVKGLHEQLERDVSFVNRHAASLAIIMFELDGFGKIADRVGLPTAERIIKQVATTLLGAVRKEDSVGRIGHDKFVLILPMAKTEAVTTLARRLCNRVESFKLTVSGEALPITMSAGICVAIRGEQTNARNLLQFAEQALRNAQQLGVGEIQLLKQEPGRAEKPEKTLTIDQLLETIAQGKKEITDSQLNAAVQQLLPLVALMSAEQRRQLLAA